MDTFDTLEACKASVQRSVEAAGRQPETTVDGNSAVTFGKNGEAHVYAARCLPDTVKP
jgi:hypothetical protein